MLPARVQLLPGERDRTIRDRVAALRKRCPHRSVEQDRRLHHELLIRRAERGRVLALRLALALVRQRDRVPGARRAAEPRDVGGREAGVLGQPVCHRGRSRLEGSRVRARLELADKWLLLVDALELEDRRRVGDDLHSRPAHAALKARALGTHAHRVPLRPACVLEDMQEETVGNCQVQAAFYNLHTLIGVEQPIADALGMVQHVRQDRTAIRATVRVRIAGVVPAEVAQRHILAEPAVIGRQIHVILRILRVPDVEYIPGPHGSAARERVTQAQLVDRERVVGTVLRGVGDCHVRRDRPVGQPSVFGDVDALPVLAAPDHKCLKSLHCRPQAGARDDATARDELVRTLRRTRVADVRCGHVERGELAADDAERVARQVWHAPRLSTHGAQMELQTLHQVALPRPLEEPATEARVFPPARVEWRGGNRRQSSIGHPCIRSVCGT